MSAYPLMLDGSTIRALVVGGGNVATRKVRTLLDAGAAVHVVAPAMIQALLDMADGKNSLRLSHRRYSSADVRDATLVIAATDAAEVNQLVAADARAVQRLVNVASEPELGNCTTPAMHRAGELVIAVTAGGVPTAAVRIRDSIGRTFDARFATAIGELAGLRRGLLDRGDGRRWTVASKSLIGSDFCADVESGTFGQRLAEWR